MKTWTKRLECLREPRLLAVGMLAASSQMIGCEVDSYLDPSRTGYFEFMPTTIPILERIDVIERDVDPWGQTTSVASEDLIPSDLAYKLSPSDVVTVQIFELYAPTQWHTTTGRIDAGGFFRLPEIGDVRAAGMTAQDFEDRVTQLLDAQVMQNPLVDVVVEVSSGFNYTIFGAVAAPGLYSLNSPDLRLIEALAIAGGVPLTTERIFVSRQIPLDEKMKPGFERDQLPGPQETAEPQQPEINIEDIIRDMRNEDGGAQPGVLRQDREPMIDIDELQPIREQEPPVVDLDEINRPAASTPGRSGQDTFIYDEQRGEWIKVRSAAGPEAVEAPPAELPLALERVIEIPYQRLRHADSSYNIVIRPDDRIYIQEPMIGVVYIDGEVSRPGVYSLPTAGGKLTLSRLITAAGGFGPLAIPSRVDLTRLVGDDREATIRLNLKAIRNRAEPDVMLRPDDHIIIGTNFWATPLAVIRNGFRATYGFGFLLDRNFGNDVFGAPPRDIGF